MGSRLMNGSSRNTTAGSCRKAAASMSFCRVPFDSPCRGSAGPLEVEEAEPSIDATLDAVDLAHVADEVEVFVRVR